MACKRLPHHCLTVRGNHWVPVDFHHKGLDYVPFFVVRLRNLLKKEQVWQWPGTSQYSYDVIVVIYNFMFYLHLLYLKGRYLEPDGPMSHRREEHDHSVVGCVPASGHDSAHSTSFRPSSAICVANSLVAFEPSRNKSTWKNGTLYAICHCNVTLDMTPFNKKSLYTRKLRWSLFGSSWLSGIKTSIDTSLAG